MKFDLIDCCPVPAKLAPAVRRIKHRSGATLQSCDRSTQAEPLLRKCGKKSQRQLYALFLEGRGNAANRPGQSTHERRSDGVAYGGPVGHWLPYWCVGMDWDIPHVQAVVRAAHAEGYTATVTYPTSTQERQHVNFRREPRIRTRVHKKFRSLRRGKSSPRVADVRRWLYSVRRPDGKGRYLTSPIRPRGSQAYFDDVLESALRLFQHDHGQHVDGIYGLQTSRQLQASVRYWRRKRGR